ncbi:MULTISPECIES: phosphoribosyl-ATP diphosphatase [Acidianus]|uniref:Phosphoribosyl-ATP pyrophosphatase n=1 Tax=Candidatus Acidianus copahuensis TaxID=1160895 RepID=A0A031LT99_9CREN|nr:MULTISPECIES: phosphoribosyl-ATP diphosphatase [Acidianus]EZQ11031.1 phosphoribosyl-ATP pyrophosphatase [Candidatus Acidianus copahuensis]NON62606.1 phosphoribosyl-ATP diphosphatase [Acidianus sp. RZ1]
MSDVLDRLYEIIIDRVNKKPQGSYTVELLDKGKEYIARKVGEEAVETIVASLSEGRERFISESADLIYHLWVLMSVEGVRPEELYEELRRRMK